MTTSSKLENVQDKLGAVTPRATPGAPEPGVARDKSASGARPSGRLSSTRAAAIVGLFLIVGLTLAAIFAPAISPYDPTERVGRPFQFPSTEHRLGTNDIGQDILSELIWGARVSLLVGIMSALIAIGIGTTVGLLAGYYDRLGAFLMRIVDIVLVLPFLPLLILLAAYLGRSLTNTILIIGLLTWAGTARVIRAQVLAVSQRDYVLAAQAIGAPDRHIVMRHLLPQVTLLAVGQFVEATSAAILLEAALSFLGLGDPLQKSWGGILYWAQVRGAFLTPAWLWWVLPPGLLIVAASLGFALVGFSLEQKLNPRLKE
jgi:peptide/nickel transport system permease protein